jgi:hypothetical protein
MMLRRPSLLRAIALVTIWLATGIAAASAQGTPDPESRVASLRGALQSGDANRLAQEFPSEGRVLVILPRFDAAGFLGPGPLRALLRRITAETRTLTLALAPDSGGTADDTWRLKVRWTYVEVPARAERAEDLYLALRRDPRTGVWLIVELRASK